MKISLDGGALCTKGNIRFGNYIFTQNLIEAIREFDRENDYTVYSFCQKPDWLREFQSLHYKILKPATLWLSTRVSLEEISRRKDVFLALNQAIPLSSRSRIISFSHGLSFYYYPHFYPDSYYALKDQLDPMVKRSKYVITPSRRVKSEMEKLFPDYKHFKTLYYGVPYDMQDYIPTKKGKFFLYVGMNHPIKNVLFLLKVFAEFRKNKNYADYKLYLVGNFKNLTDEKNGIVVLPGLNRDGIKKLYVRAAAYVTASYYESFNFPILEALAQNCPVIGLEGAVIPEFNGLVSVVYNQEDFLEKMVEAVRAKFLRIDRREILQRFSWKKYTAKLRELY